MAKSIKELFGEKIVIPLIVYFDEYETNNLLASLAHTHRALRAQFASLAKMSAPRVRDLMVVALRAQCCALHSV